MLITGQEGGYIIVPSCYSNITGIEDAGMQGSLPPSLPHTALVFAHLAR